MRVAGGLATLAIAAVMVAVGHGVTADADTPHVEAIAQAEIDRLGTLGYPVDLADWHFVADYENSVGGTATTWWHGLDRPRVDISTTAQDYLQFSSDIPAAVRSTVRHELGHVITTKVHGYKPEQAYAKVCRATTESSIESGAPAMECAAEAVSEILSHGAGEARVPFYGIDLSGSDTEGLELTVSGSLTWD